MPPDDKKTEEDKKGVKQSPWSLLSMLPSIAGGIAGMVASPQRGELKKIQKYGGAAARQMTALAGRVGQQLAATQAMGHGATKGLGINPTSELVADATTRLAGPLAMAVARESAAATDALRMEGLRRLLTGQQLGNALTGAIADAIALKAAAKDQGVAAPEVGTAPAEPEQAEGVLDLLAKNYEVLPGQGVSPVPTPENPLPGTNLDQEEMYAGTTGQNLPTPNVDLKQPGLLPQDKNLRLQPPLAPTPEPSMGEEAPTSEQPAAQGQVQSQGPGAQGQGPQGQRTRPEQVDPMVQYQYNIEEADAAILQAMAQKAVALEQPLRRADVPLGSVGIEAPVSEQPRQPVQGPAYEILRLLHLGLIEKPEARERLMQEGISNPDQVMQPTSEVDPEWIYGEVAAGRMEALEAERVLKLFGYPVDLSRLGQVDISGAFE